MSYFDNFKNKGVETPGVPGVKMNKPLAPRAIKGDVGLEFELEATNDLIWDPIRLNTDVVPCPVTGGIWTVKEDHSLRGGAEYVTTTAVSEEAAAGLVRALYTNLAGYGTRFRLSNRCSTHVHLNASTWRINTVTSFFLLWGLIEPAAISFCGPRRKTNHFCLSIQDTQETVRAWTAFLKKGVWSANDGCKYSAMNLLRLFDIGTVEIRCGDAYHDPEKAIDWIKFLNQIRLLAEKYPDPSEIPGRISEISPIGLLESLCEAGACPRILSDIRKVYDDRTLEKEMYASFREVIHLANFPWEAWMPLINKTFVPNPFGEVVRKHRVDAPDGLAAAGARIMREFEVRAIRDLEVAVNRVQERNEPRVRG